MAVVFVAKGGLAFARSAYRGHLQAQLLRELKRRLFDAYTHMEYRHYIRRNTGHFINVITGQVNRFFTPSPASWGWCRRASPRPATSALRC